MGLLLVMHFIADFLLQPRDMGKLKSEKFEYLLLHCSIQWAFIFLGLVMLEHPYSFTFASCNALIHGVIDWFIWRGYKAGVYWRLSRSDYKHKFYNRSGATVQWMYWEDSWFYTTIGFDQLLHIGTLFLLWETL